MREQDTSTAVELGISYLPVTPGVAAYYNLGVNSGALVTELIPGSLAAKAGVQIGDVILSFNGVELEEAGPLLGMMRECPAGHGIALEIWRERARQVIHLAHVTR